MNKKFVISLIGAPASGKGYIAASLIKRLKDDYGFEESDIAAISVGAMIRQELKSQTPLGQKLAANKKEGGVAPDSIVLTITRVEDPQELDTRFAKFAPSGDDTDGPEPVQYSGADDIIDLFHKLCDVKNKAQEIAKKAAQKENEKEPAASEEKNVDLVRTFHFSTLDDVISSAKALNQYFTGSNSLYKNTADANYQLVLHQSGCKPEEFNKACNILSEYGRQESFSLAAEAFLLEHGNAMVKENALQELASL